MTPPAQGCIVRAAVHEDLLGLLQLRSRPDEGLGLVVQGPSETEVATWVQMLQTENLTTYVADLDGEVAGAAQFLMMPNLGYGCRPSGCIEAMVVATGLLAQAGARGSGGTHMTNPTRGSISVTIVANDPPFRAGDGVLFGLQAGRIVQDPVPACATTEFPITIDLARTDNSDIDFSGEHVHGRRGDRFIYLSWGIPDQTEPFVMFARAKIKLDSIPDHLLNSAIEQDRVLIAHLRATNTKGQPASGTINPPAIDWHSS